MEEGRNQNREGKKKKVERGGEAQAPCTKLKLMIFEDYLICMY